MLDPNKKYIFEYQDLPNGVRLVALDCHIKDLHPQSRIVNGEVKLMIPEHMKKDCTNIDGCVYYYLGRCHESYLNELVEFFNKALKLDKNWKRNDKGVKFILRNEIKVNDK